jgi:hypothetical protein
VTPAWFESVAASRVTRLPARLRLAGLGGGVCAAIGVLAFRTTTVRLVLASATGFLIGAMIGFALAGRVTSDEAVVRADRVLKADVVATIVIAWGLVALGIAELLLRGWSSGSQLLHSLLSWSRCYAHFIDGRRI